MLVIVIIPNNILHAALQFRYLYVIFYLKCEQYKCKKISYIQNIYPQYVKFYVTTILLCFIIIYCLYVTRKLILFHENIIIFYHFLHDFISLALNNPNYEKLNYSRIYLLYSFYYIIIERLSLPHYFACTPLTKQMFFLIEYILFPKLL